MISSKKLQSIGLSEKEATIYLALLKLNEARVSTIAKATEMQRTTVYSILEKLLRRGIVNQRTQRGVKLFYIADVRQLEEELAQKQARLTNLIPDLLAAQHIGSKAPRITTFEGPGGQRDYLHRILDSTKSGDTIREYIGTKNVLKNLAQKASFYPEARRKKKVRVQILAPKTNVTIKWAQEAEKQLRTIRFTPPDLDGNFGAILQITPNSVGTMSFEGDFSGVIIEHAEIQKMMESFFQLAWFQSK